jgi:hypothetical protein
MKLEQAPRLFDVHESRLDISVEKVSPALEVPLKHVPQRCRCSVDENGFWFQS